MEEIARLIGGSDRFELGFVERESTPEPAMKLGIRLHLAGQSLSNTISILDRLGAERVALLFTTGCRRPIYSPQMVPTRITLRSTKP